MWLLLHIFTVASSAENLWLTSKTSVNMQQFYRAFVVGKLVFLIFIAHTRTHTYIQEYTHTHTLIHIHICLCMNAYVPVFVHERTWVYVHICVCVRVTVSKLNFKVEYMQFFQWLRTTKGKFRKNECINHPKNLGFQEYFQEWYVTGIVLPIYIYIYIRDEYDRFPDFFRAGI